MKKTFSKIVTALLIVALVFGVCATTVGAATVGSTDYSASSGTNGSTGSSSNEGASAGGGTTIGDSLSTGWCDISYDENGLTVILNPDVKSLLDVDKEEIKEIVSMLIDAAKALVIDDLKDSVLGEDGEVTEDWNADNIWKKAMDAFIEREYSVANDDTYEQFLRDAIENGEIVNEFVDYACGMLKTAVNLGVIDIDDLPKDGDVLRDKIIDMFETEVNTRVSNRVNQYAAIYIDWLETNEPVSVLEEKLTTNVIYVIERHIETYIKSYVTAYINGTLDTSSSVGSEISGFIDGEIKTLVTESITNYANGELDKNDDGINELIDNEIDTWVREIAAAWPNPPASGNNNLVYREAYTKITSELEGKCLEYLNQYFAGTLDDADLIEEIETLIFAVALGQLLEQYWTHRNAVYNGTAGTLPAWYAAVDAEIKAQVLAGGVSESVYEAANPDYIRTNYLSDDTVKSVIRAEIANYNNTDWKNIWDSLDVSVQNGIIVDVEATDAFKTKIRSFISTIWESDHTKKEATVDEVIKSASLNDIINKVLTDAKKNPTYKRILDEKAQEFVNDGKVISTLRDIIVTKKTTDVLKYQNIKKQIDSKIDEVSTDPDIVNSAFIECFDCDKAYVDVKLSEYAGLLVQDYLLTLKELTSSGSENGGSGSLLDLLEYVSGIYVNGETVYDGSEISTAALKALINELPRPAEIADMADEQMKLTWNIEISTDFGTYDFSLTVGLGGGYDKVRKMASIIAECFEIYVSDGTLNVHVKVPAKFAEILLKACKSDRVPETLKKKVFKALSESPDDAAALVNSFTFDELLELLDRIDFEGILDSDFVSRFERLDGLTEEQIKAKIAEYEYYYNKLLSVANRIYNKVPDSVKDKTILDFYKGDGKFAHAGSYTVDVEKILTKVSDKYGPMIAAFLDNSMVTVSADLSVTFEKINRVEYVLDGTTVREGLLPAGANLAYFSGVSSYDGLNIVGWEDENGVAYTEMPDKDVVLYAVLDVAEAILTGAVDKTYDGEASTLEVTVAPEYANVLSYKWYKDGVLVDGATGSTLSVLNAKDSGSYRAVVTVNVGGVERELVSNYVNIAIDRIAVDVNDIEWDYDENEPFTYDGTEHSVSIKDLPEYLEIVDALVYSLRSRANIYTATATDAGTYTAKVTVAVVDDNYKLVNGNVVTLTWTINPKPYTDADVSWNYTTPFTYSYDDAANKAVEHTVSLVLPTGLTAAYTDNVKSNKGNYTAKAVVSAENGNYVWKGSAELTCDYVINAKTLDLSAYAWNYDPANPYVYNAAEQTVAIVGLPGDVQVNYTNAAHKNAIESLTATATVVDNFNYNFTGAFSSCVWKIEKAHLDLGNFGWNYDDENPFVYTYGTTFEVSLVGLPTDAVVVYTGKTQSDVAGENFVANATVTVSSENYISTGTVAPLTWSVKKRAIDLDSLVWADSFTYDGTVKTPSLTDTLPADLIVSFSGDLSATNAGTYTVTVAIASNDNYTITGSYDHEWKIEKLLIDLSTFDWNYTSPFTYDGTTTFKVLLKNLGDLVVIYTANESVAAGAFTATAAIDTTAAANQNYAFTGSFKTCEWKVEKVKIYLDTFDWDYTTPFTYDGTTSFKVTLKDLGDLVVIYTANESVAAGTFTATATIDTAAPANDLYEFVGAFKTCEWKVEKVKIYLDTFDWDYTTPFTYNGTNFTVALKDLGDIVVVYTNESAKNAGTLTATAVIDYTAAANDLYEFVGAFKTCEWTINKKTVDLSEFDWSYTDPFTYNGSNFTVVLDGIGEIVVVYTDNAATNAGTYTASATIDRTAPVNANYIFTGVFKTCEWTVNKAFLNLGELKWNVEDTVLVYNSGEYEVYLIDGNGNRVAGISYTGNKAVNAGTYTATAILSYDNYVVSGNFSASYEWEIKKAVYDMSTVTLPNMTVDYNGQLHTLVIVGTLPDGVTVTYSANSFSAVGEYTVTATFTGDESNYEAIAPMTAVLKIAAIVTYVNKVELHDSNGLLILRIEAEDGIVSHYVLNRNDVTGCYETLDLPTIFGEGKVGYIGAAYDIHFTESGTKQPMSDNFTVRLLIPNQLRAADKVLKVVHIADNGDVTDMAATRDGDYMVFNTTHFSVYAIIEVAEPPIVVDGYDFTWLWILLAIIAVLAIAAVIVLLVLRRRGDTPEEPTEEPVPTPAPEACEAEPEAEEPVEVEEEPAEEPTAEEPIVEEAPVVEEPAVEEPAAEEPVVEEAPAAEEPVVEEAPAAVEVPVVVIPTITSDDEDGASGIRIIDGVAVPVRYRSSFMSRMIQSEPPIQDYYTVVKNALLSYKGVKARTSWNFESFNKGRIQCAKLNVKGKNFLVYLGLDPNEYNVNKYHFVDVSDKPKLDKVPMMLKVKSERGLKYVLELVEEMMNKFGMERIDTPTNDYHMPYETTEALVERELIKVILPPGVTLDDASSLVKVNVGALIDTANAEKADREDEMPTVEEAVVAETPVVEETIFVDAVVADTIISDAEAEAKIEMIEKSEEEKSRGGKLCEINLDTICENFEDGDTVTLTELKAKKLASKNAGRVKVLARGVMSKKLIIVADKFSIQAVKMITLAGGLAEQYK